MDLDDQFSRSFGTADPAQVPPAAVNAGIERRAVDLGMEQRGNAWAGETG